MPITKAVNQNFFKKWSPEMAYVLGFFTADGNMSPHSNGGHYLEFTSCDKELISKTRKILESNHKISSRARKPNSQIAYRIQIGSKALYEDLRIIGLTPNKSLTLKFPKISQIFLKDFIRGYFDGDGCVYFKKHKVKDRTNPRWIFQVKFSSGSRQFLESLHKIIQLTKVCKGGFVYTKRDGHELCFSHHDGLALFKFMYDNVSSDMYLERKYETFQKAIKILHLGT